MPYRTWPVPRARSRPMAKVQCERKQKTSQLSFDGPLVAPRSLVASLNASNQSKRPDPGLTLLICLPYSGPGNTQMKRKITIKISVQIKLANMHAGLRPSTQRPARLDPAFIKNTQREPQIHAMRFIASPLHLPKELASDPIENATAKIVSMFNQLPVVCLLFITAN